MLQALANVVIIECQPVKTAHAVVETQYCFLFSLCFESLLIEQHDALVWIYPFVGMYSRATDRLSAATHFVTMAVSEFSS